MQFMQFSAIFVLPVFLVEFVALCGTYLEGWDWGCCDSIPLLGCKQTFFCSHESCSVMVMFERHEMTFLVLSRKSFRTPDVGGAGGGGIVGHWGL